MKLRLLIILSFFTFAVNAQDSVNTVETDIVYEFENVDVKPEYPGGDNAFLGYIAKNYSTPELDNGLYTIRVSIIIEKDGTMNDIKIVEDPGYGLGDEAIRVIKLIDKKWKPGVKEGMPVRVKKNVPIKINIKSA